MKDKHHGCLTARNRICAYVVFGLLGCVSIASAQPVAGNGFTGAMASSTVGNATSFSKFMGGLQNIDRFAITQASDGTLLASTGTRLSTGAAVQVSGNIAKADAAAVVGRFAGRIAGGLVPVAGLLFTGYAIYDLAQEHGFTFSADGSTITKADPAVCGVAPCYGWQLSNGAYGTTVYSTAKAMCDAVAPKLGLGAGAVCNSVSAPVSGYVTCYVSSPSYGAYNYASCGYQVSIAPVPSALPSSVEEFADAIASASGWPTSSALGRAVVQAVKSGESVAITPTAVTGPASTPGPSSVKTDPNGNVTTNTTTNNYNYAGNTVTVTNSSSSAVYNPTTGTTETTTETTEEPQEPKDPCESNPERVGCAKLETPEGEVEKQTRTVTYAPEVLFGEGSCPASFTMVLATTGQTVTPWDWSAACDKVLPLRALVMALASLTALFILAPGGAVAGGKS